MICNGCINHHIEYLLMYYGLHILINQHCNLWYWKTVFDCTWSWTTCTCTDWPIGLKLCSLYHNYQVKLFLFLNLVHPSFCWFSVIISLVEMASFVRASVSLKQELNWNTWPLSQLTFWVVIVEKAQVLIAQTMALFYLSGLFELICSCVVLRKKHP